MPFFFPSLPLELAFEILRLAATSALDYDDNQPWHSQYQCATSLALVSHNFRQIVMPHLLHTVILSTQYQLNLFLRTLEQQKFLASTNSRLRLNYPRLVRRLWSSECYEPYVSQMKHYYQSYEALYSVVCKAQTLGIHFLALHLLYEIFEPLPTDPDAFSSPLPGWTCSRVTFAGYLPRWNPIIQTANGQRLMKHITHLTVWAPQEDTAAPPSMGNAGVPNWFFRIPFNSMPKLTHLAVTLVGEPGDAMTRVLVYVKPSTVGEGHAGEMFRTWAASEDPLSFGRVIRLDVSYPEGVDSTRSVPANCWERAYYAGEHDIWPKVLEQR